MRWPFHRTPSPPVGSPDEVPGDPPLPPVIVGHRVIRAIASDERADTLLGMPDADAAPDGDLAPRVLVVHRGAVPREQVDRSLVALARAQGDHVVALLDVGTMRDGRIVAVLQRLEGDTLAALLRVRQGLELGEAVTVLVPIATALERMHAAGVAHGAVTARRVRFTANGSPTLLGFADAELFDPESPEVRRALVPAVIADRAALLALAEAVLARVAGAAALELLETVRRAPPSRLAVTLVDGLFRASPGLPVRFQADDDPIELTHGASRPVPAPPHRRPVDPLRAALGIELPDALVDEVLDGRPLRALTATVRSRARGRPRRERVARPRAGDGPRMGRRPPRPAVVAGLAGAIAAVVAWFAVPAAGEPQPPVPSASAVAVDDPLPTDPLDPATEPHPELDALVGDDAGAAAVVLLTTRADCLRELDAGCLAAVDQADSAALRTDLAWIAATVDGEPVGEVPALRPGAVTGTQPLGGAAVVAVDGTPPASLLLVRSEAGWRIRDVIAVP